MSHESKVAGASPLNPRCQKRALLGSRSNRARAMENLKRPTSQRNQWVFFLSTAEAPVGAKKYQGSINEKNGGPNRKKNIWWSTFTETHAGSYGSSWHLIFVVDISFFGCSHGPMALESRVAEHSLHGIYSYIPNIILIISSHVPANLPILLKSVRIHEPEMNSETWRWVQLLIIIYWNHHSYHQWQAKNHLQIGPSVADLATSWSPAPATARPSAGQSRQARRDLEGWLNGVALQRGM